MMETGTKLASAAVALIGTPFQLGGRNPSSGLDCIGLVVAAIEAIGRKIPVLPSYSLRQHEFARFLELAELVGLKPVSDAVREGDVLLLRPSPSQAHLAICLSDRSIVHAHAELRRIVITPAPLPWPTEIALRLV